MRNLLAFLLFVPFSFMAQVPDHVPTDGLVAWYPLYDSLEEVVGGHDGQSDSPTFETGGGLFLQTGDSPVNLPQSLEINQMDGSLTLGGWIRLDDSDMVWRVVMDLTDGDEDNSWTNRATLSMEKVQGELRWTAGLKTGDDMANNISRVLSLPEPDIVGLWRHVMAVWDVHDVVKIYVNGSPLDGSLDIADAANFNLVGGQPGSRRIGGRAHNTNQDRLWHGAMKDIGVWGRALSATEIQSLALVTQQPGCTDPDACNFNPTATQDDGSCLALDLGEDIETCLDFVALDAGSGFDSYLWNTGDSTQSIQVTESGIYSVSVTEASNCNEHALLFDGMGQNVIVQEIEAYERDMHTVSLWCSITDMDGGMDLVSKDDELSNRQWLLQLTSLGQFYGHVWTGTDDLSGIISTTQLTENQWYYLTQTWDGEQLKIYINSTLEGAVDTGTGLDTGDHPVTIGGDDLGWQAWTHGSIDNVEIWDVALTQEQIQTNMACSPSGQEEGLVAYWDFNAGDGSVAFDQSAYTNHGSINGPLWIDAPSELDCQLNCQTCEITDEVLVDFDDCDDYCGEGTIWDNAIQQCVSITESGTCPEGTVWDDDIQGCICSNDEPESDSDCECPTQPELDGFISYGSFEGSHYYFHPESMSWAMADSLSTLNGGHLVTIGSQQEQDHLETLLEWSTDAHWIGLYQNLSSAVYQEPSGGWEWVTGEPLDYDNWRIGEPNEATPGEDFGTYIPAEGWNDGHNGDVPQVGTPWPFIMEVPCCAEICNDPTACGPGTVWDPVNEQCIVAIPTDTDFDGCVTAGDVLNLLATFGTCPPIPFSGPCQGLDHVTYQGHDYDIVAIGEQCWFAENLQAESYRNGDEIPYCANSCQWGNSEEGARSGYGDTYPTTGAPCGEGLGSSGYCFAPTADVVALFGHLYNWHAVVDERELCPSGWTVPSTVDFENLIEFAEEAGTATAAYLKADHTWLQENADAGLLGFDALAGGYGGNLGGFDGDGYLTMFWGSTQSTIGANAEHLQIEAGATAVFLNNNHKQYAQYVRCIKD